MVTGGAGFIGSEVVGLLLKEGWRVTIFDNFSTGRIRNIAEYLVRKDIVRFVPGDVRNYVELFNAAEGVDVIFHLAAHVSVRESMEFPEKSRQNNVIGTENVFKTAVSRNIKKVVFSSSCSVYPEALSPYAKSKLIGEEIARKYYDEFGISTICLRYFNVYGPKQSGQSQYASVIPKFLEAIEENRPPKIFGDGEQTRDFIFVEDVAKANLLAANLSGYTIFNVMTGSSVTVNDLWELISIQTGTNLVPRYEPVVAGEAKHAIPDPLVEDMKIPNMVPLHEGLRQTISGRLGSVATATHS